KAVRLLSEALLLRTELSRSSRKIEQFAVVLDLLTLIHAEAHFQSAAMLLCNEAAARFHADRVSLGWISAQRMHLRAMSHAERFERKMNVIVTLESAMEEA